VSPGLTDASTCSAVTCPDKAAGAWLARLAGARRWWSAAAVALVGSVAVAIWVAASVPAVFITRVQC